MMLCMLFVERCFWMRLVGFQFRVLDSLFLTQPHTQVHSPAQCCYSIRKVQENHYNLPQSCPPAVIILASKYQNTIIFHLKYRIYSSLLCVQHSISLSKNVSVCIHLLYKVLCTFFRIVTRKQEKEMKVDDENKDARKRVTFSIYFHLFFCSKLMLELWLCGIVL